MSEEKKSGEELLDDPEFGYSDGPSVAETPFDQTVKVLTVEEGKPLELMCRATHEIIDAASIAYNIQWRFHSAYIGGKIEQIERFSVSFRGMGRDEMVRSLQAGSGVPDGFFESQNGLNKGYIEE